MKAVPGGVCQFPLHVPFGAQSFRLKSAFILSSVSVLKDGMLMLANCFGDVGALYTSLR